MIPLPETAAALGDVFAALGRREEAARQYALVEYIGRLDRVNKVLYNRELAYFYVDHDVKLDEALTLARARAGGAAGRLRLRRPRVGAPPGRPARGGRVPP